MTGTDFNISELLTRVLDRLPPETLSIAKEQHCELYAVGGGVRDFFLGRDSGDLDLSVVGDAVALATELARRIQTGHVATYARFGTALVRLGSRNLEFAASRRESYSPESRNPAEVSPAPIEQDLSRRDFTVNALALGLVGPHQGRLLDLFGGLDDLRLGVLRTPLNPNVTFSDDPLRMLRAARFAAEFGFRIETGTFRGIINNAGRLQIIVADRIRDELWKMLSGAHPVRAMKLLIDTGLMQQFLPEVPELAGVEQVGRHHHKDVLAHSLKVMQNVAEKSADPTLRLAALLHDIGKPHAKRFTEDAGWTFHGHEVVGARMASAAGQRLALGKDVTARLTKLVSLHMRPVNLADEGVTDSAIRRLMVESGDDLDALLTLGRADITTANSSLLSRFLANFDEIEARIGDVEARDKMRRFHSPLRGDEIMALLGLTPGPMVGALKERVEDAILNGEIPFDPDAARDFLFKIKDEVLTADSEALAQERRRRSHWRKNVSGGYVFPE